MPSLSTLLVATFLVCVVQAQRWSQAAASTSQMRFGSTVTFRLAIVDDPTVESFNVERMSYQRYLPISTDGLFPSEVVLVDFSKAGEEGFDSNGVTAAAAAAGLVFTRDPTASSRSFSDASFENFQASPAIPLMFNETWLVRLTMTGTLTCSMDTVDTPTNLRRLTRSACETVGTESVSDGLDIQFVGLQASETPTSDSSDDGGLNTTNAVTLVIALGVALLSLAVVVFVLVLRKRQREQELMWEEAQLRPAVPEPPTTESTPVEDPEPVDSAAPCDQEPMTVRVGDATSPRGVVDLLAARSGRAAATEGLPLARSSVEGRQRAEERRMRRGERSPTAPVPPRRSSTHRRPDWALGPSERPRRLRKKAKAPVTVEVGSNADGAEAKAADIRPASEAERKVEEGGAE